MKSRHKTIRTLLSTMAPKRAESFLNAFNLPEEERRYIWENDVRKKSYQQISDKFHVTHETIKHRKQQGYAKIADQLEHGEKFDFSLAYNTNGVV